MSEKVTTTLQGLVLISACVQSTRYLAIYFSLNNIYRDRSFRAQDISVPFRDLNHAWLTRRALILEQKTTS
jgi:hypothetical protein